MSTLLRLARRPLRRLPRLPIRHASTFQPGPSPPRLPEKEQAEFERLQRTANTQAGFNATATPDFSTSEGMPPANRATAGSPDAADGRVLPAGAPAIADSPGMTGVPLRKGAPPEFEGETNPRTGEVGGPKNEPLRWGPGGDYSFNGRVTDF
ncbi:DUF1674-domain-containing protein [Xylariomycetidae sp. FL0641]|nr:DUF1674-domain-containing protein [Xylariomycetidae sp. FL0641]